MKLISKHLLILFIFIILPGTIALSQSPLESGMLIPVYPGSKLITDVEPGESLICCNFVSKDGFDKIVSFYESSLKIKSLDANGLATQIPSLKPGIEDMLSQMPPEMKVRFFVLKVVDFQGQKGAELFEVSTGTGGVHFSIMESQFKPEDMHFYSELNTTGVSNSDSVDPNKFLAALPASGPAGFETADTEFYTNPSGVTRTFRKLKRKAAGGEEDDTDQYYQIIVSISVEDNSEFTDELLKVVSQNEKAVTVKGLYKGKEIIEKNDFGCVQSNKIFLVNNRFFVEITASLQCDINIINELIDKMDLKSLPE